MMTWDSDTVLMPVPLRWAQQVADYLAALQRGQEPDAPRRADDEDYVDVPDQGRWTRDMVAELADRTPYEGVNALLDRCARHARDPESWWVLKADVEEELGISAVQLRNELGAFSKLIKKLFPGPNAYWPMEYKKEQGKFYYRMPAGVADWWIDARGQS